MASRRWGQREEPEAAIVAEINITPLTDVFLVLLIIFMVTSSAIMTQGVGVELPKASTALSQEQPDGVVVSLLARGQLKVNEVEVQAGDFAGFTQALKAAFLQTPSRLVVLQGDRQAFLGAAIEVMDHARLAGAQQFAIATTAK